MIQILIFQDLWPPCHDHFKNLVAGAKPAPETGLEFVEEIWNFEGIFKPICNYFFKKFPENREEADRSVTRGVTGIFSRLTKESYNGFLPNLGEVP